MTRNPSASIKIDTCQFGVRIEQDGRMFFFLTTAWLTLLASSRLRDGVISGTNIFSIVQEADRCSSYVQQPGSCCNLRAYERTSAASKNSSGDTHFITWHWYSHFSPPVPGPFLRCNLGRLSQFIDGDTHDWGMIKWAPYLLQIMVLTEWTYLIRSDCDVSFRCMRTLGIDRGHVTLRG